MNKMIPKEEQLNEQFIIEHADCVNWSNVSQNVNLKILSNEFFVRFENEIDWGWIVSNKSITTKFAHKYKKQVGGEYWYKNGNLHREDGPAIVHLSGSKFWYRHGLLHRSDGPAIVYYDNSCEWWSVGIRSYEDYGRTCTEEIDLK